MSSHIDDKAIEEWVQKELLDDPDINVYLLPDAVEKRVYTKLIKKVLNLAGKLVDGTEVDVLGHKLVLSIQPVEDKQE